jgi:hypothetical protein
MTPTFIDCAKALPMFFDLLGQITFQPARADNEQNIAKISNRFQQYRDREEAYTLQGLSRLEKSSGVAYSGSASEALRWLTRTLDFTVNALEKDLNDNRNSPPDSNNPDRPLSEAFKAVYPNTLWHHHNDVTRQLFMRAFSFVPSRKAFFQKLAAQDNSQAALQDTEKWVRALRTIVDILNDFTNHPDNRW